LTKAARYFSGQPVNRTGQTDVWEKPTLRAVKMNSKQTIINLIFVIFLKLPDLNGPDQKNKRRKIRLSPFERL
jgi:hypothetical protein